VTDTIRNEAGLMAVMFVYVTTSGTEEAERIARVVVADRLAACANVHAPVRSIYWWQGALEEGNEAVLILKTTRERIAELIARVKALHSYECPCIEALEVTDGNSEFLAWVARETGTD
jgi:periplasmic divalent cation tolerance protein